MTERELLYVKTIADEKSISKAAQKLYVSQPSLSQCVGRIEQNLGTKLFVRTNSGLIPTFTGERYYKIASQILKIYNDFEVEVSDICSLKKGRLTIGLTNYLGTVILPTILPLFEAQCPNFELQIIEKNSTELERDLAAGGLDFAVMHTLPESNLQNFTHIDFHHMLTDPFVLVVPEEHPLNQYATHSGTAELPGIDLQLFAKEPFIMVSKERRIRQMTDFILARAGIFPNVIMVSNNYETVRRLASHGMGITLSPYQYAQYFKDDHSPVYYKIDDAYLPYWNLCVAVQRDAYISKAARLFIEILANYLGNTDFSF